MLPPENKKILIIEDEPHIAEGLRLNLELKKHQVFEARDGAAGLRDWRSLSPDLIVLDIMLPVLDGWSVLKKIRSEDEFIPILILSAKGDSEDKVKGFSYGVDDYLAKPFNLEEFLLRVERLLIRTDAARRAEEDPLPGRIYRFGENEIDFSRLTATVRDGLIHLTEQEARLLKCFITNRGRPVSRGELLEAGCGYSAEAQTRTIDNFLVRFRKYFEKNPRKPVYFKSLRSVGYVFNHEED